MLECAPESIRQYISANVLSLNCFERVVARNGGLSMWNFNTQHLYRALYVSFHAVRNLPFDLFLLFKGQIRSEWLKASCQNMQAGEHAHMGA